MHNLVSPMKKLSKIEKAFTVPIEDPENFGTSVKDAKFFSESFERSVFFMELCRMGGTWIPYSFLAKNVLNTIKPKEYDRLVKIHIRKIWPVFFAFYMGNFSQKFFKFTLRKFLEEDIIEGEVDWYMREHTQEEIDKYSRKWVEHYQKYNLSPDEVHNLALEIMKHKFDAYEEALDKNKIGVLKQVASMLSSKCENFLPFEEYEIALTVAWYEIKENNYDK